MKKFLMTGLTLLSFSASAIVPAPVRVAQAFAAPIGQLRDALNRYPSQGIRSFSGMGFSRTDRAFLHDILRNQAGLPSVTLNGHLISLSTATQTTIIEIVAPERAQFKVNGQPFEFRPSDSLQTNATRLMPLLNNLPVSWLDRVIPSAHADFANIALIAVLAVAVIALIWGAFKKTAKPTTTKPASDIKVDTKAPIKGSGSENTQVTTTEIHVDSE